MTLLVADDSRRSFRDVLGANVVAVDAEAVSDALAREDPRVVVVDAGAVADATDVVQDVRSNARGTAVVAVGTTGADADVTCPATDAASIRAAVTRARRVADYRRSVADLYETSKDRALGRPDADVRHSRSDADEKFGDLPTDREAFSAALRAEGDVRNDDAGWDADAGVVDDATTDNETGAEDATGAGGAAGAGGGPRARDEASAEDEDRANDG